MSEENIALLRRAWAAYDRGDAEAFAACLTDDWREYDGAGDSGALDDERKTMALHAVAFPDKHTAIHRIVADDDPRQPSVPVSCHGDCHNQPHITPWIGRTRPTHRVHAGKGLRRTEGEAIPQ